MPSKGLELYCFEKPEWQTVEIFDQKEETVPHIMPAMIHQEMSDFSMVSLRLSSEL